MQVNLFVSLLSLLSPQHPFLRIVSFDLTSDWLLGALGKITQGFFLSPASSTVKMGMPFPPHRGHWEAKMRQCVGKDVEGKEGLAVKQTS